MKVSLYETSGKTTITYPCILDDQWQGERVIVLALGPEEGTVLRSWHEHFKVGMEYGNHTGNAVMYKGTVTLEN